VCSDGKAVILYWYIVVEDKLLLTQAERYELLLGASVVIFVQYLKESKPFAVA
jgi:hypothetical protein